MTVITLNIHNRGIYGWEVPGWMEVVFLKWIAPVLCLKFDIDDEKTMKINASPERYIWTNRFSRISSEVCSICHFNTSKHQTVLFVRCMSSPNQVLVELASLN